MNMIIEHDDKFEEFLKAINTNNMKKIKKEKQPPNINKKKNNNDKEEVKENENEVEVEKTKDGNEAEVQFCRSHDRQCHPAYNRQKPDTCFGDSVRG